MTTTKPQHEGWEAEFDERLKGKIPNDALMITISRAEWLDHLSMEKSFIRTHIEAAQEDMRRKCIAAVESVGISAPGKDDWEHENLLGRNKAVSEAIAVIKAITPIKD